MSQKFDQFWASARPLIGFAAGGLTVYGVQTVLSPQDLMGDLDHMVAGAKEFWLGAGPLLAAGLALWGRHKASMAAKVASIHAAEPAELVQAVQNVAPVVLRDAVAAQTDVKSVVMTTQAGADASPSPKVKT